MSSVCPVNLGLGSPELTITEHDLQVGAAAGSATDPTVEPIAKVPAEVTVEETVEVPAEVTVEATITIDLPKQVTMDNSYEVCRQIHKLHGTTYYWATKLLPKAQRPHVHALYGFCRYADEIVDAFDDAPVEDRRHRLDGFEARFKRDLTEGASDHPVLKAVVHTTRALELEWSVYQRFFRSMRMDLDNFEYPDVDALMVYVDGSAAAIGEMMVPVLEPSDPAAVAGARNLGISFQLTNFLRDVGEDLDRGRVYFPRDELAMFGVDIEQRAVTPGWREFCQYQIDRISELYDSADEGIEYLPSSSARSIRAARVLYSEILDQVVANDFDVVSQRARVPMRRKLWVAAREAAQLGDDRTERKR